MIPEELQSKIKWRLWRLWQNTYGPIEYNPPTREQCEKLGFSHEEGIAFYDECLAESGMIEVKPGFWDFKKMTHPPLQLRQITDISLTCSTWSLPWVMPLADRLSDGKIHRCDQHKARSEKSAYSTGQGFSSTEKSRICDGTLFIHMREEA